MKKNILCFFITMIFVFGASCENSNYPFQNSILSFSKNGELRKYLITDENIIFELDNESELCSDISSATLVKIQKINDFVLFNSYYIDFFYNTKTEELGAKDYKITYKKRICPENKLVGKTFKGKNDENKDFIVSFINTGFVVVWNQSNESGIIPYTYNSSKNIVNLGWCDAYYNSKLGILNVDDIICYDEKEVNGKDYFYGCDNKSFAGKELRIHNSEHIDNMDVVFYKDNIIYTYGIDDVAWHDFGFYKYYPGKSLYIFAGGYFISIDDELLKNTETTWLFDVNANPFFY